MDTVFVFHNATTLCGLISLWAKCRQYDAKEWHSDRFWRSMSQAALWFMLVTWIFGIVAIAAVLEATP